MIKIQVLFFGKLKEIWNTNSIDKETNNTNIEDLYAELLSEVTDMPYKPSIKVAINDEFVEWGSLIKDGDVIAFLPPASGG